MQITVREPIADRVTPRKDIIEVRVYSGDRFQLEMTECFLIKGISIGNDSINYTKYDPDSYRVEEWPQWVNLDEKRDKLIGRAPANVKDAVFHLWVQAEDLLNS